MTRALPPGAVERILARATELAMREYRDSGEGLGEARLLEIAREAGLSPEAMRQALAEERAGPVAEACPSGIGQAVIGAAMVEECRVVAGPEAATLARLEQALTREGLMVVRRLPTGLQMAPRTGLMDQLSAALDLAGHGYPLRQADQVHVRVADAGDGRSFVRMVADHSPRRLRRLRIGFWVPAAGSTAGLGVAAFVAAIGGTGEPAGVITAAGLIALLAGTGLGMLLARAGWRARIERARLALALVLDKLERPADPAPRSWLPFP